MLKKIIRYLDAMVRKMMMQKKSKGVDYYIDQSLSLVQKGSTHLKDKADPETDLEELHFELTYKCNQKCIMCDVWPRYRENPELKKEELTFDEIIKFVEKSRYLNKIKLVLFSGGEPFLREDIVDLCGFFLEKKPDISIGILSNLYDTKLTLGRLRDINTRYAPKKLWIGSSLDGIGQQHDNVRSVKSAYEKSTATIDAIRKEFPQINLSLNFTLTTSNYKELLSVYEYATNKNLDFSAQFTIPWENTEEFVWDETKILKIEKATREIIEKIVKEYEKKGMSLAGGTIDSGLLSKIYYLHGLTQYKKNPHRFFKMCVAGAKYAMISPRGDLYFCPVLKNNIVGNIRDYDYDFDSLWMSGKGAKIRNFINKGSCHCWLNCTIYPNVGEAIRLGKSL